MLTDKRQMINRYVNVLASIQITSRGIPFGLPVELRSNGGTSV